MKFSLVIFALFSALFFAGCSKPTSDETIALARKAIEEKDFVTAQKLLDDATQNIESVRMPVNDLLDISLLYMIISENHNEEVNVASAVACFDRAEDLSPDSVRLYINSLDLDQRGYFSLLSQMNRSVEARQNQDSAE